MSRLALALIVILGFVAVSATIAPTTTVTQGPFVGYGSIITSHDIVVRNTDNNEQHLHYVINNFPATRDETLYEFACLYTLAAGIHVADVEIALHVARPSAPGSLTVTYAQSVIVKGIASGVKTNVYGLGLKLQKGDFLTLSAPKNQVEFRVGTNEAGLPVQYGIITVQEQDKATPVGYTDTYELSTMPTSPTLAPGQFLQICAEYGTFGPYNNKLTSSSLFIFTGGADQFIVQPDNGKYIESFTVGLSNLERSGGFVGPVSVTVTVARRDTPGDSKLYVREFVTQLNPPGIARTATYSGVSNGVLFAVPIDERLFVQEGDLVGIRVNNGAAAIQFNGLGNLPDPTPDVSLTYYTYTGSASSALVAYEQDPSTDQPNFRITLGGSGGSGTRGDPQFAGFQGQNFQFHGLPDDHFNLISSPDMQLNSHFVYLSSGKCDYNNTLCFQHPGTYVDVLGFTVAAAQGEVRIKVVAGSHNKGLRVWFGTAEAEMREVHLNAHPRGLRWSISNTTGAVASLTYNTFGEVTVDTPMFTINVVNSDYFFNIESTLKAQDLLRAGRAKHTITDRATCQHNQQGHNTIQQDSSNVHEHGVVEATMDKKYGVKNTVHGLLGQTWRNAMICGKPWMGGVQDYIVSDLFANDYFYRYFATAQ